MNRLILLGNGFDLAHGLKTSYNDFIKWYFKKCLLAATHTPFEDCMIYIKKENFGFGLAVEKELDDYVEMLYSNSLIACEQTHYRKEGYLNDFQNPYKIRIKSELLKKLFTNCSYNSWVEVENEFYQLLKVAFLETGHDRDKKIKDLNESLSSIISELENYLLQQEATSLIDGYKDIFNSDIELNDLVVSDLDKNRHPRRTMILNFNYTATIEEYITRENYKIGYEMAHINYIHGQLNKSENPIIFGFGDEHDVFYQKMELERNKSYLKYIKSFWYFKTENYHNLLRFIGQDRYQIVILGHSCGLSDRTMLNMLFEHDNCASIKIYYYDNGKGYNNHEDLTYEISQHFRDKLKMRRVIVPKSNSSPMPQLNASKMVESVDDSKIGLN